MIFALCASLRSTVTHKNKLTRLKGRLPQSNQKIPAALGAVLQITPCLYGPTIYCLIKDQFIIFSPKDAVGIICIWGMKLNSCSVFFDTAAMIKDAVLNYMKVSCIHLCFCAFCQSITTINILQKCHWFQNHIESFYIIQSRDTCTPTAGDRRMKEWLSVGLELSF